MEIRRSQKQDIDKICEIYEIARKFMAKNGNPTQWGDSYPTRDLVMGDIEKNGYVVVEGDRIIGVFVLEENADEEAYRTIDGKWKSEAAYGVVHRCASRGMQKGVGQFLLDWCFSKTGNIRIDTHEDNAPMKKLLAKNGYEYCGKIYYPKAGERIAFQKIK